MLNDGFVQLGRQWFIRKTLIQNQLLKICSSMLRRLTLTDRSSQLKKMNKSIKELQLNIVPSDKFTQLGSKDTTLSEDSSPRKQQNIELKPDDLNIPQPIRRTPKNVPGLDDFDLYSQLGQGAFGVVFLAKFKQINQFVALKVQSKGRLLRRKQIKYAITEAKITRMLDSPFVIKLYCSFQTQRNLYLAMDFCCGSDLYGHLTTLGRFREDVAKFYICETLLGLEYLHSKDIVYRDLKPENILICQDGHIKIADYGLSKMNVQYEVQSASFCGSPAYMSPEVLDKQKTGKYVDYYSLGIVLYELLTGAPPFIGNQLTQIFEMIKTNKINFPAYISENARDLIRKLTLKDYNSRMNFDQAKQHPFFKNIDWSMVQEKRYTPPLGIKDFSPERKGVNFQDQDTPGDNTQRIADFDYVAF